MDGNQRSAKAAVYRSLYKDPRWPRMRADQLRAEPYCAACAKLDPPVQRRAWIVDHVKPHRGNAVLFFNGRLQSLCKPHHDQWKQRLERTGQPGKCDPDGLPLDPAHPWNAS